MNTLTYVLRFIVLLAIGMIGMAMALVFMVSTAIAIGVLYIVARLKGRPFGVRAYWAERNASRNRFNGYQGRSYKPYNDADVIDVEAREIP